MAKIKLRRDTAANWTSADPILAQGEPGFETTTGKLKIGDGTTSWSSLTYLVSESGTVETVLPYLEITNVPFITAPAELGEPVTVTVPVGGQDARVEIVIGEGPVITSITVTTPGTGYVAGQKYILFNYQAGGNDDADAVTFFVDTVGENGELLTVTGAEFAGAADNTPGTYSNQYIYYRPSVLDVVGSGVTLVKDYDGLYNAVSETGYNSNVSPAGTLWNSEGWGDLVDLRSRNYVSFNDAINNTYDGIVGRELVLYDTINEAYYKFEFTVWDQNSSGRGGGYSYTRTPVTDPNYFRKTDYGSEVDIIVEDDGQGAGIGITRGNNNSIYNPYREEGYNQLVSPDGTLWNIDGWDDLSDIESRTYSAFYAAYNGNLGLVVPGSKAVMYVPETGKYYAVGWLTWTQGGNGGGFSYIRKELDLTKLNEGVKFADGTTLKSAEGLGRVKSTAPNNRRIEEAVGFKQVSVTQRVTGTASTSTAYNTVTDYYIYLNPNQELSDLYNGVTPYTGLEVSLDNITWYDADIVGGGSEFYQFFLIGSRIVSVTQGDTIYYRVITGGAPVTWWDKDELPSGGVGFRGAVIEYHAYTGDATWIGTIHVVDDNGDEHITHTEVSSGSTDSENDDLWVVTTEGRIRYRRIDGDARTLKIHWTAKVFYGDETYD